MAYLMQFYIPLSEYGWCGSNTKLYLEYPNLRIPIFLKTWHEL